ncbi:MAG: hypothetical protein ACJAVK_003589, partial [Akkermansiaceae bacterium]
SEAAARVIPKEVDPRVVGAWALESKFYGDDPRGSFRKGTIEGVSNDLGISPVGVSREETSRDGGYQLICGPSFGVTIDIPFGERSEVGQRIGGVDDDAVLGLQGQGEQAGKCAE